MSNRARIIMPVVVIVAAGSTAVWLATRDGTDGIAIEASGTVEATDADLGFQLAGRIEWISLREGDRGSAGQEVAALDRSELIARQGAAEAQLAATRFLLRELESGFRPEEIAEVRAGLQAAAEWRADAERDVARTRRLFQGGAVSQEALDKAETAYQVAEAGVDQARERLSIMEQGPRQERIAAQRALVEQAEAAVDLVEATLENAVVRLPFDGVVTVRHRGPGETVAPGLPVLTLMDLDDRWVRIYVPENRIGAVSLGQRATISSDTYSDREYQGEVFFIASEAEFTPRNVQTPEERVKLVYAVKVRITGDAGYDLKPGTPADVVLAASEATG
jgi:HlyD family secretion protein